MLKFQMVEGIGVVVKNMSMLVMVGVCCLLWNTVKIHVSGTGTNLWLCVVYCSTSHFWQTGL